MAEQKGNQARAGKAGSDVASAEPRQPSPSLEKATPGLDRDRPLRNLLLRGWSWTHSNVRALLAVRRELTSVAKETWDRARRAQQS